jgi:hypothetical protein
MSNASAARASATKKSTPPVDPKEEKKAPSTEVSAPNVNRGAVALPDDMMAEAAEFAGAGTSSAVEDNIVPFLSILQDNSPEVKSRHEKYVEGAQAGDYLLKSLRLLFPMKNEQREKSGDAVPDVFVQHANGQKKVVEWIPRTQGGGFVAHHEKMPAEAAQKEVTEEGTKRTKWILPNGHELIETRYEFVIVHCPALEVRVPAVVSFSSTGHTVARQWNSMRRNVRLPDARNPGQSIVAPSWFRRWQVGNQLRKNAAGEWFVPTFTDAGWVTDATDRAMGQEFFQSIESGKLQAGVPDEEARSGGGDDSEAPM